MLQIGAFHLQQMLAAHGVNGDKATERAQTILGAFSDAPPFPDVGEALERLHGAGIKVKVGQQCDEVSFHVTVSGAYLGCRIFTLALSIGSRVAGPGRETSDTG